MTEIIRTKKFSEFNIKPESAAFVGPSIEITDLLNNEIIIIDYKIEPSKFPKKPGDMVLTMQIEYEGKKRVVFSGSIYLQQMIQKVPKDTGFPCEAVIIKEKDTKRLVFKSE